MRRQDIWSAGGASSCGCSSSITRIMARNASGALQNSCPRSSIRSTRICISSRTVIKISATCAIWRSLPIFGGRRRFVAWNSCWPMPRRTINADFRGFAERAAFAVVNHLPHVEFTSRLTKAPLILETHDIYSKLLVTPRRAGVRATRTGRPGPEDRRGEGGVEKGGGLRKPVAGRPRDRKEGGGRCSARKALCSAAEPHAAQLARSRYRQRACRQFPDDERIRSDAVGKLA